MFIPQLVFFEFVCNGIVRNGFITASPDIKFIVAEFNRALFQFGIDLELKVFPKFATVETFVDNQGVVIRNNESTVQVELVGEAVLYFREPVGLQTQDLFKMFFPKQTVFNFENIHEMSKHGIRKVTNVMYPTVDYTIPITSELTPVNTMIGYADDAIFALPNHTSKLVFVAATHHELYPDINSLFMGMNVTKLDILDFTPQLPVGFPETYINGFVYNTYGLSPAVTPTLQLSATGKNHPNGLREKAKQLFDIGQITEEEFSDLLIFNGDEVEIPAKVNLHVMEVDYISPVYPELLPDTPQQITLTNQTNSAYRDSKVEILNFTVTSLSRVKISLDAAFDAFLSLFSGPQPVTSLLIESDDDDGPGTNSYINRFLSPGTYSIEIGPFSAAINSLMDVNVVIEAVPNHPVIPLNQSTVVVWDGVATAQTDLPYPSVIRLIEITETSTIDVSYTSDDYPYELRIYSGIHPAIPGSQLLSFMTWGGFGDFSTGPYVRQLSDPIYGPGTIVLNPGIYALDFSPFDSLMVDQPTVGDALTVLVETL